MFFIFNKLLKKFDKTKYLCYTVYCWMKNQGWISLKPKGFYMIKKVLAVLFAAIIFSSSMLVYADTGVVNVGVLNVRETPNSHVIGQLTYGQNVAVTGCENGWYKIDYNGKIGYIFGNYVTITKDDAAEMQKEDAQDAYTKMGENILSYAKQFLGVPYVYGGSSPYGFDCSGFVKYVYQNFGVNLPRTSYSQMQSGYAVNYENMLPGDILVFRGGGHVGIYAGNGTYIHAPSTGRSVSIDPLDRSVIAVRRIF